MNFRYREVPFGTSFLPQADGSIRTRHPFPDDPDREIEGAEPTSHLFCNEVALDGRKNRGWMAKSRKKKRHQFASPPNYSME